MKQNRRAILRDALIDTLPVMAGYLVLGTGFGLLLRSKGFGLPWALAMSIFIFAGSMQYVAVSLLSGGATLLTAAFTTLTVNCRHLFYGISVIEKYRNTGKFKPYLIFALSDETYSLVVSGHDEKYGENGTLYCFFVSLLDQCYWVIGTVIGSTIGALLTFSTEGVDFTMTALFLTIVIDRWRAGQSRISAILGIVITIVCLLVFGSQSFLIPSMLLITAALFLIRGKEEKRLVD